MALSADVANRARSRLGMVLNGKWRLDEIIGIGGMATVYAAMHRNQKRAAVKMLHSELSIDETVRTRFLREGYMANTVDHPGAVMVFDDDIAEDGSAFLVMELLEGETVQERLIREEEIPLADVLDIAMQVLDVLVAAHEKGIVHRDLKPDNLFVTRSTGLVKLLDFGIARVRQLPIQGVTNTSTGMFMGTPAFMAPEHARGMWSEVDGRSDIWSLGATLFTMLTGTYVHDSETPMDTLVLAITQPAPPIRDVKADVPFELAQVVDKALAYRKEDRWDSARAMRTALRKAIITAGFEEEVLRRSRIPPPVDDQPNSPAVSSHPTQPSLQSTSPPPRTTPRPRQRASFGPSATPPRKSVTGVAVTASGRVRTHAGWQTVLIALLSTAVVLGVIFVLARSREATSMGAAPSGSAILVLPPAPAAPIVESERAGERELDTVEPVRPPSNTAEPPHAGTANSHAPTAAVGHVSPVPATRPNPPSIAASAPKGSASAAPNPAPSASHRPNPFDLRY